VFHSHKLIILLLLWVSGSAYAQIGTTESQIVNRWKGGRPGTVTLGDGSTRKQIYFPHGNHGCGVELEYVLDPGGTIKFEQWASDCKLSPADVLKQSEPGYTWYSVDGQNWFGHGENKPGLHAFYRDTHSSHILDIATLVDAPDRGEDGLELMDLE
jgi:hypothetical protein